MTLHGCGKNWGLATSGGNGHHAVLEMFSLSVVWRTFHAMPSNCLEHLPPEIAIAPGADAVRLIDVLWIAADAPRVVAAFEVEHSTSIYSGIVRMLDLALSGADIENVAELFLVAPDTREKDVRAQLARPAFSRIADLKIAYLPYTELASHREQIARFGSGMKAIRAISRPLSTLSRSE